MKTNQNKDAVESLRSILLPASNSLQQMCGVLNFEYRSVCGINTLPSRTKLA